jgi:hypothetical protein
MNLLIKQIIKIKIDKDKIIDLNRKDIKNMITKECLVVLFI